MAKLEFDWTVGRRCWRVSGSSGAAWRRIGRPIPIHVDSQDPQRWTARTTPPPLLKMLRAAGARRRGDTAGAGECDQTRGVIATWRLAKRDRRPSWKRRSGLARGRGSFAAR